MEDLQCSIPSMVDGLKPGQRKILFCFFKRNFVKEEKVAQFLGYVCQHSAYYDGEQSIASTIIGMAQDFVGSNNINLLQLNGQFGTRIKGGKDSDSARNLNTQLSPITRILFPKEDDVILDYMNEDGRLIEPTWYVPIIPMVLVNGSEGSGTGWSYCIPNYNPRDIVKNLRRLLDGEAMVPMNPWYRGFKVSLSELNFIMAKQEGLEKKFKLTTTSGTTNMHLFNRDGVIKKYDTPEQILEEFFHLRFTYYEKRKNVLLGNLELDLLKLDNKIRFVLEIFEDRIIVGNRKQAELILELHEKGFAPIPKKSKSVDVAIAGATVESEESDEETTEVVIKDGVKLSDYRYLLSIPMRTLIRGGVQAFCAEKEQVIKEVEELRSSTPRSLWKKDLDALEKELDELDRQDAEAEEMRKKNKADAGNGGIATSKQAPKKPRKINAKAPIAVNSETVQEGKQNQSSVYVESGSQDENEDEDKVLEEEDDD